MNDDIYEGDTVIYHGTHTQYHDKIYIVTYIPDGLKRGYILTDPKSKQKMDDKYSGRVLTNVHRESFTKIQVEL